MRLRSFAVAALIAIALNTQAQENILVWNKAKAIQWQDFSGSPKDSSDFDAEVFAEVRYSYRFHSLSNFVFDVKAIINRNTSWAREGKRNESLLRHEQVHFDIAALYALKMRQAFNSYIYTSNYQQEVLQIFSHYKEAYHKMQQQYDEETQHSLHTANQQLWETWVAERLATPNDETATD